MSKFNFEKVAKIEAGDLTDKRPKTTKILQSIALPGRRSLVASTASVFVASDSVRLGGTRKGLILRAFAAAPGLKAQGGREHTKGS